MGKAQVMNLDKVIKEGAFTFFVFLNIMETQLAKELNMSQVPVREAVLELGTIGMLEERPYSGTYVRNFTAEEIEDTFEAGAFIEEYAAKRAAKQATEEQLARMREVLERMSPGQSLEEFVRLDKEFHGLVMDASGSPALKRVGTCCAWRSGLTCARRSRPFHWMI